MSSLNPDAVVRVRDWSPGFQDSPEPDTLPNGAMPDARNCLVVSGQLSARGSRAVLRRRGGSELCNATVIAAGKTVDALTAFRRDGASDQLLAACDGKLVVFDEIARTFTQVGATAPFTAGRPARFAFHNNQAYICDGVVNQRYNGTALLPVGFAAPTGAPALSAVAPSGAGVTGTFEGFAVWYDQATTHESDRSAVSAQVACSAQDRRWTKPAGTPPANVTHWRVYCRRVDTNEINFFLVGSAAVATGTLTESVIDAARTQPGPQPSVNTEPPYPFEWISVWKGHGIACRLNDSSFYVSKQGDLEAWDARNLFKVQRNEPLRSGVPFGTQFVLQTDSASFLLRGDRVPFTVEDLHSEYGNVSQEAAVEVDGWLYAWDRRRGPYRTNTVEWEALGDNRIQSILNTVDRLELSGVRAEYFPAMNMVVWAVPLTDSPRRRTLLAFNYRLNCWHPPITGLEYASLATFCDRDGVLGLYAGDYWGRVYKLFTGSVDGTPDGSTFSAPITAASSGSVTSAGAGFYTAGSGLVGMPAAVESPAGAWQWVRVASNTGDTLTFDTVNGPSLDPVPATDGTWKVHVGAIRAYCSMPMWDFDDPYRRKRPHWIEFQGEVEADGQTPTVEVYYDGSPSVDESFTLRLPASQHGMVWDRGLWDIDTWAARVAGRRVPRRRRLSRTFHQIQIVLRHYHPHQGFALLGVQVTADLLLRRRTVSV